MPRRRSSKSTTVAASRRRASVGKGRRTAAANRARAWEMVRRYKGAYKLLEEYDRRHDR